MAVVMAVVPLELRRTEIENETVGDDSSHVSLHGQKAHIAFVDKYYNNLRKWTEFQSKIQAKLTMKC